MPKVQKFRNVGVVIDLDWPYKRHHEVFAGIHKYTEKHKNWKIFLAPYSEHKHISKKIPEFTFDGIVGRVTRQLAAKTLSEGVPLVNVWKNSPTHSVPTVTIDSEAAGRMAGKHLVARGFENFGFLGFQQQKSTKLELAGFRSILSEAGFSCKVLQIPSTYTDNQRNWQKFSIKLHEWIDGLLLPVGILTTYDLLARYVVCACERMNLKVPQNVAVIGLHNEPIICNHPEPSLTSIELGFEQIGYRAAELLEKLMDGAPPPCRTCLSPASRDHATPFDRLKGR